MKRDNAPVGNTCPMIDEVINAINSFEFKEDSWWDKDELVALMEKIRSANLELRNWGNDLHIERDTIERDFINLSREYESMQDELKSYANT